MMLSRVRQGRESVLGAPQGEDSSYREGRETPIPLSQEDVTMAYGNVTDEELAELIRRTAKAASAFICGDMSRYLTLIKHADDYTLMAPFGGEPTRGFDASSKRLEAMERYFQAGEAELELVQSYASGDIVVLVVIERQHGEVGGLPDQDWSLRVTLVY